MFVLLGLCYLIQYNVSSPIYLILNFMILCFITVE